MPHSVQIRLEATSGSEAQQKAQLLQTIGEQIDLVNLEILAKAAKKPGINKKIQQFKTFL